MLHKQSHNILHIICYKNCEFGVVMEDYIFLAKNVVGRGPPKKCAVVFVYRISKIAAFASETENRDFFTKKSSHF